MVQLLHTYSSKILRLVGLRRIGEQRVNRPCRLRATLLLKFVDPVCNCTNHVTCGFLRCFPGVLGLRAGGYLPVSLLALNNSYFLSHSDSFFLSVHLFKLFSLTNSVPQSFNQLSLERLRIPFLAKLGPNAPIPLNSPSLLWLHRV